MKKSFLIFALLVLLLSACSTATHSTNNNDTEDKEDSEDTQEELGEIEEEQTDTTAVTHSIRGIDVTPILDYPNEKWSKATFPNDRDYKIVHNAYIEDDTFYIGSDSRKVISYQADYSANWAHEHKYGFDIELAIDNMHLYSHTIGSPDNYNFIRAIDKQTGNVNYEIDLTGYGESGEVFSDNGVLYMILGKMSDEDTIFADIFSFHAYDAKTGNELWSEEIGGLQMAERNGPYQISANESMIFYFEKDYTLVARSKEDGSVAWVTPFDDRLRFVQAFIHNDQLYVLDRDYIFHVLNIETGEIVDEIPYDGEAMGPEIAEPIFIDNRIIMQHMDVEIDQHQIRGLDIENKEIAWIVDLDGYFAFGVEELNGTIYALLGDLDFEAENPTRIATIHPVSGEIIDLVELDEHMTPGKVNGYNRFAGHTVHNGVLTLSKNNILYGFY